MATIKPFAALRPRPELAGRVCELPYDVLSSAEARLLAAGNPLSFLRVSKPEIDLPPETDLYAPEVYAKGKENFDRLIAQGVLLEDAQPGFYLYRQTMGGHIQTGLVALASCVEYLQGIIKKHELTRLDKEEDRRRHIETLNAQTGPAFLVYRARAALDELVAKITAHRPAIDFVAADGVGHTAWIIHDPGEMRFIETEFAQIPAVYIADGHHRTAAAARVFQQRNGAGASGFFLAVIFPHDQMQILPYNRVLKDLNGLTPAALWQRLGDVFLAQSPGTPVPTRPHELSCYFQGGWHTLTFRPALAAAADLAECLDAALLQQRVLGPIFGIADPRTSKRISFVGGGRGVAELAKLVDRGEYACAFSLHPTRIEDLMAVADAGGIMPPKSTWFEPKLRDAMFCHCI